MAMQYGPEIIDKIVEHLEEGKSLVVVCRQEGMPGRSTVYDWLDGDDELALRLLRAREVGYHFRAEMAVAAAKNAKEPIAGRLAFDAERWYLGKLSNAFRDKPLTLGAIVNVDGGDAFAAVREALDRAAASLAGSGHSTRAVALPSPPGSGDPTGGLADMAGAGGERLGEDKDGR